MAPTSLVTVEGLPALRRRLRRIEGGLQELKAVNKATADYIAAAARPGVPHRTGRLAGTMRTSGTNRAGVIRAGTARVPYAAVIHYGWPARNIAPRPWVITAALRTEPAWTARYQERINDLVERTSAQ